MLYAVHDSYLDMVTVTFLAGYYTATLFSSVWIHKWVDNEEFCFHIT